MALMNPAKKQTAILWRQVLGLAGLQGAITLCWLIYHLYFPQLLAGVGMSGWGQTVILLESILAIVLEPIAGSLSDRQKHWLGTRFPIIGLGVILASALFIAIPIVFGLGQPVQGFRFLLPGVLIAWAGVMALFRSPATALLGQYAKATVLPQAMSVLVLVGGLVRAIQPIASDLILSWGPNITFTLGSLTLLLAVIGLRSLNPNEINPQGLTAQPVAQRTSFKVFCQGLGSIIGLGISIAWGTRLMLGEILPAVLVNAVPNTNLKLLSFAILALLAMAALPAGRFAVKVGNRQALLMGLLTTAGIVMVMAYSQGTLSVFLALLVTVASYSLVANGAVPFALSAVPVNQGGLGVGLYFSGFSLGMALYDGVMPGFGQLSLVAKAGIAAIAFLLGGVWVRVKT
ncbi:MAG: MFS transporter [Microcoleaceae cyanobacterium]